MKTRYIYTIITGLILTGIFGCRKNNNQQIGTGIIGVWVSDLPGTTAAITRETYQFNTDSTVLFTRVAVDVTTGSVLGYYYRSTGKFSFDGTTLKMYQLSNYSYYPPGGTGLYYTAQQNLSPITGFTEIDHPLNFNGDHTVFNFVYPPCPINASCIGTYYYTKQ